MLISLFLLLATTVASTLASTPFANGGICHWQCIAFSRPDMVPATMPLQETDYLIVAGESRFKCTYQTGRTGRQVCYYDALSGALQSSADSPCPTQAFASYFPCDPTKRVPTFELQDGASAPKKQRSFGTTGERKKGIAEMKKRAMRNARYDQ